MPDEFAALQDTPPVPVSSIDEDLRDDTPSPMILVHMSPIELEYLDYFQGGPSFMELVPGDPSTKIREYSRISDMMAIPEIKKVWDEVFGEFMSKGHGEHLAEDIEKSVPAPVEPFQYSEGDFDPDTMEIEAAGQIKHPDDTSICYMPIDFANYLDSFRGETERDPVYKLRQYGKRRKLFGFIPIGRDLVEPIRIAATVAGAVFGGPVGAGVGTALGNLATGADLGASAKRGLGVYGLTSAAGSIGQWAAPEFMASNPNLASALGQGSGGAFGDIGASFGATQAANLGPMAAPSGTVTKTALPTLAEQTSNNAAPGLLDSVFNKSNILPMAGIAGLMYLGNREEQQLAEEEAAAHDEKLAQIREREGWTTPFRPYKYKPRSLNPVAPSREDILAGRQHQHFVPDPYGQYAKGGSVEHETDMLPGEEYITSFKYLDGNTKGQDDKIPINLPEGSYVTDASVTSMLGDGNSKAGARIIEQLSHTLKSKAHKIPVEVPKGRVPSLLSDGEAVIPPEAVSALGGGSNKKGASILKKTIQNVRAHKAMNKGGLPPKAKSILAYLPQEGKRALNDA